MSNTYTPAPGAAPLGAMIWAQAKMEAQLLLRNGEQLVLALVVPALALIGGIFGADYLGLDQRGVDVLTPGVLTIAIMSTSFTSLAIATGFERRYGVIKRLGASPLPRLGLLAGKVLALLLVQMLQMAFLCLLALVFGWRPEANTLAALIAALLGTAAFTSWGLFIAGVLRAEATLAAANLIYVLLLAGGAAILPASTYGGLSPIATMLPSGALGEGMRSALMSGAFNPAAYTVLALWALVGTILTARTFSWE